MRKTATEKVIEFELNRWYDSFCMAFRKAPTYFQIAEKREELEKNHGLTK